MNLALLQAITPGSWNVSLPNQRVEWKFWLVQPEFPLNENPGIEFDQIRVHAWY